MSDFGRPRSVADQSGHSCLGRLRKFLEDNPGEFLSIADVAEKFEVSVGTARQAVHELQVLSIATVERVVYLRLGKR